MLANLRRALWRKNLRAALGTKPWPCGGDRFDLSCQKRCRAYGGSLLDITVPLVGFTD